MQTDSPILRSASCSPTRHIAILDDPSARSFERRIAFRADFSDAIVQEDLMKAVRKLNDAKKHETGM